MERNERHHRQWKAGHHSVPTRKVNNLHCLRWLVWHMLHCFEGVERGHCGRQIVPYRIDIGVEVLLWLVVWMFVVVVVVVVVRLWKCPKGLPIVIEMVLYCTRSVDDVSGL